MTDEQRILDDICRGAADEVYMVHQARRLLEEIDTVVAVINDSGIGKGFFAGLQGILQRELVLGLTRVVRAVLAAEPRPYACGRLLTSSRRTPRTCRSSTWRTSSSSWPAGASLDRGSSNSAMSSCLGT